MPATLDNHLAESLFRPATPINLRPEPIRDIQHAAQNAHSRWPELADMVDTAVILVEGNSLYEMAEEPALLAFCLPVGAWTGHLVSLTATGLGCTCDAWPPAKRAGPGDGLYCPDILALLLQVYLRQPLRPLRHSPESLWQEALGELRHHMARATFTTWLAGSEVVPEASSSRLLTIRVRNRYAQEWLGHRLQPVINRVLAGIVGYGLETSFVVTPMRSEWLQTEEKLS
jgi:hypothetical protein